MRIIDADEVESLDIKFVSMEIPYTNVIFALRYKAPIFVVSYPMKKHSFHQEKSNKLHSVTGLSFNIQ